MRFFALLGFVLALVVSGCALPKDKDPKIPYTQYRTTKELQTMRLNLEEQLRNMDKQAKARADQAGGLNNNRRQLPNLLDEQAADQRKSLAEVQAELTKRYEAGDAKAYYQGMRVPEASEGGIPVPSETAPQMVQ
jgi:hypothetical protein